MNDIKSELISANEIEKRVSQLAADISTDYAGRHPLIVSILKGSFVFAADLARRITVPCTFDFMAVSSYGARSSTSGAVKIVKDLDSDIGGRDIIIVEDILDSGVTLSYIINLLSAKNPGSLRLCVLLDKPARRKVQINAEYRGFEIPDEFVVGYGLDYNEMYRNLPYIGILDPSVYMTNS